MKTTPKTPPYRARIPRRIILTALAAAAILLPAAPSQAASILWGTPTFIAADTDVSLSGTLAYAFNFGLAPAVPSATVNGVTFAPFGQTAGTSVTVGNLTVATTSFALSGDNTLAGSVVAPFSSLSAAYRGLLQSAITATGFPSNLTMTLGGLTIGQSYQVQLWANDSQGFLSQSPSAVFSLTAGNTVVMDVNSTNAAGGVGQWVRGTFTANATTQTISADAPSTAVVLNAIEVRAVPEPGSAVLLLAGAGAVLRRRRRATL